MKSLLFVALAGVCLFATVYTAAVVPVAENANKDEDSAVPLNISDDCRQPKEIGRCFALFHRFAFNMESGKCEEFIYGGCGGNPNNFETKEECESKCFKAAEPEQATTEAVAADEATTIVAVAEDVVVVSDESEPTSEAA